MKRSPRLVLAKEALAPLASEDLAAVAGGAPGTFGLTCYTGLTVCGLCDPR